jgi:hypothetical protein
VGTCADRSRGILCQKKGTCARFKERTENSELLLATREHVALHDDLAVVSSVKRQATFDCSVGREDRQRKPQQLATSMWLRCTLEQWARHSRWRLEERALDRARKAFEQPHPCQGAGGVCGPDGVSVSCDFTSESFAQVTSLQIAWPMVVF